MAGRREGDDVARRAAGIIRSAFDDYLAEFAAVTRRSRIRFEACDWHAHQADALERLNLYSAIMDRVTARLEEELGERVASRSLWAEIKHAYAPEDEEPNSEMARTFHNSVTRRLFSTVGVNPDIEFTSLDLAIRDWDPSLRILRIYEQPRELETTLQRIFEDYRFRTGYRDLATDVAHAAERVGQRIREEFGDRPVDAIEMVRPVFFRNKAAYLMGRVRCGDESLPLILALLNSPAGAHLDAVLMREAEVSILFSFTRSYFHVETDCPREMIVFLKAIIPLKPVSDLYSALGFNKHGKTELYRSLARHLKRSTDLFDYASGDRGMVMIAFTLPSYDRVFKVIRDNFDPPKNTTAQEVIQRYRLVYQRDRVGRLVEAQLFRQLRIPCDRLTRALTDELLSEAARTVSRVDDQLVFDRIYTERRVVPLNLYLRSCTAEEARIAVLDYGAAIKELAAANIFPGDFLMKNFGVTRHGRVVFYDYDELCLLTDCRFRRLPPARTPEEEMALEPWFAVAENDIFPEEFRKFLGIPQDLIETFEQVHGELFDARFWRDLQRMHRAGAIPNFFPYPDSERFESRGTMS
jgi:isocitrate dehydrogenase kinase/phosphatase